MTDQKDALVSSDESNQAAPPEPIKKRIQDFSVEQLKKYNLAKTNRSRDKKKKKQLAAEYIYDSKVEIKESGAKEILESRGIKAGHVLDVVYDLAVIAADMLGVTKNRFYFANGVEQTLASYAAKSPQPLPEIEDVWNPGERIRLRDLHALWDFGMSWREQADGQRIDFSEFRRLRRMCMTDTFRFGCQILQKDFHPEPHGNWAKELFVTKNPDLLPEFYTQEDIKKALAGQSDIHKRLLISSRNSYKSTYQICDMISWVLIFNGDLRILMISSTKPLSRGFLKSFRAYWTVKNPKIPTLFNQLFPEFMVGLDEGSSTSFTSPCRQLDLIQPTLNSSSMESEGLAGERADLLVFEDAAEESNSRTEELREKTMEKFDLLCELLEPTGFLQCVGTPTAPGDIYSTLLEREEKQEEKTLLYQINPCWTVKPGVQKLPYDTTLTEDEVVLLFPTRLKFKELMRKLRDNPKVFRQQSLCSWVPDADSELKITFTEQDLLAHTNPASFYDAWPTTEKVLSIDLAFGTSSIADFSALSTIRFARREGNKPVAIVQDVQLERLRISELATKIIETIIRQNPNRVIIERTGAWESLADTIRKGAFLRGMTLPLIFWQPTTLGNVIHAKAKRIKALEIRMSNDELWFVKSDWNVSLFHQFQHFDGGAFKKATGTRKLDGPDSVAIGVQWAFPRGPEDAAKSDEELAQEKAAREAALLRQQYSRYFGSDPIQPEPEAEEQDYSNPIHRALRRR